VPSGLQAGFKRATTRAEFAALAVNVYESVTGKAITEQKTFGDTNDVNIEKVAAINVVSGSNCPMAGRAQLAAFSVSANVETVSGRGLPSAVARRESILAACSRVSGSFGIKWQVQAGGIMSYTGNNIFSPKDTYSVEQGIMTVKRIFDMASGSAAVVTASPSPSPSPTPVPGVKSLSPAILLEHEYGSMTVTENQYNGLVFNNTKISSLIFTKVEQISSDDYYRVHFSVQGITTGDYFDLYVRFYDANNRVVGEEYAIESVAKNQSFNLLNKVI